MKKIKYFLLLIILFFTTSCSNYDMSMKIEKDKSMEYTLITLSDYYNDSLVNNISIYKDKFGEYGYLVKEYNDNNKYGMIISKRFANIDNISYGKRSDEFNLLYLYDNEYNAEVESKMFNIDEGIATNRYAANFYVDLSDLGIDLNNTTVTYKVVLPNEPLSSNANFISEDKKTLTWNITSMGKKEIDYVFELNSYDRIFYIIAILVAVYLFFSILSNLFRKSDDSGDIVRVKYNDEPNKRVENLTNNAIKNNLNTSKTNVQIKSVPKPEPSHVAVIPPNKVSDSEEFNDMRNSVNVQNISVEAEEIPNPFGNNITDYNKATNSSDISSFVDIPIVYNDVKIENNNSNEDEKMLIKSSIGNSDINNDYNQNIMDNNQVITNKPLEDNGDIIKVNSKSVFINNNIKEEE